MMKNGAVKLQRHPDVKVAYVTMVKKIYVILYGSCTKSFVSSEEEQNIS